VFPRQASCVAAVVVASALAGCVAASVALAPSPVTLATGTPGGAYHAVGNAICRMFNLPEEHQARPCVAVSSDGSAANIQRIERGESTFGLSQTDIAYAAFHGAGPFAGAGPDPKLRMLIAFYPEAFTVVARADSGIRDFRDLRGKRLGVEMGGAGYAFTRDAILGAYGWTISDFADVLQLDPGEQRQALCSGAVDAVFFAAGHPNGVTQEVTAGCGARLVRIAGEPIGKLLATHPYYVASVIPGGMYAGNPDDVPTIATQAVLVTTSDQPDELAYAVVAAVFGHFADFRRLHPVLWASDMQDMVPAGDVMPIHPGALKYYREAGLVH